MLLEPCQLVTPIKAGSRPHRRCRSQPERRTQHLSVGKKRKITKMQPRLESGEPANWRQSKTTVTSREGQDIDRDLFLGLVLTDVSTSSTASFERSTSCGSI